MTFASFAIYAMIKRNEKNSGTILLVSEAAGYVAQSRMMATESAFHDWWMDGASAWEFRRFPNAVLTGISDKEGVETLKW